MTTAYVPDDKVETETQRIEKMAVYYQEFHHKCVTWYITIIGFFIAGVIAAPVASASVLGKTFAIFLVGVSLACGVLFFLCIAHYGARIKYLTGLLDGDPSAIPAAWRTVHKNVGLEIHGMGSAFFFAVLLGMQIALFFLVLLRYWQ